MDWFFEEFGKNARRLGRDEGGVALMLTLSVFLLLYVACAGVYSIGETVRQKIELQNACDNAAYSAAVAQADGLGRMAMVNRALSWTYVQTTNMQMDYIIYKWLQLVSKRFHEDEENCRNHNDNSLFLCMCLDGIAGHVHDWYVGPGRGWFCGKVDVMGSLLGRSGLGMLDVNGRTVSIDDIDQALVDFNDVLQYRDIIHQMKGVTACLNAALPVINGEMQRAMEAAASSVLLHNLPEELRRNMDGDMNLSAANDIVKGRDFCYFYFTGAPIDPYAETEDNPRNGEGSYFDPLRNTELDERIFLSMADGAVRENLSDYFYRSSFFDFDTHGMAGGLDQWFIRTYPKEIDDPRDNVPPTEKSYRDLGICRTYKHTNRTDGGEVLRGHHTALNILEDNMPSCLHSRDNCPDQCATVPDNTAGLYADYEWASLQMYAVCFVTKWFRGVPITIRHMQTAYPLNDCPHLCESGALVNRRKHARAEYNPCYIDTVKMLAAVGAVTRTTEGLYYTCRHPHVEVENFWQWPRAEAFCYGFSRTYGDDKELYDTDKDLYTGEVARPWVLNERFYGRDGTIVVGLARKMRNPWVWLLHRVVTDEMVNEPGIYSAFDPIGADRSVVALSAARAAHRYNPSDQNTSDRNRLGIPAFMLAGVREYETRYDAVCADDWDFSHDHPRIEVSPGGRDDTEDFKRLRIGCVCGMKNARRFANCWNLCETDWDATLIPLRYAWAETTPWFDSVMYPDGVANECVWETVGAQNTRFSEYEHGNVLDVASRLPWMRFWDENGHAIFGELGIDDDSDGSGRVVPVFMRKFNASEVLKAKFL